MVRRVTAQGHTAREAQNLPDQKAREHAKVDLWPLKVNEAAGLDELDVRVGQHDAAEILHVAARVGE